VVLTLYSLEGKMRHVVTQNKVGIFTVMKTVRGFIKMMKNQCMWVKLVKVGEWCPQLTNA